MNDLRPIARLPILLLGMVSLLAGVLSGLARLGVEVPAVAAAQAGHHGVLMISAFFGTVIALERAVALSRGWAYLGPLCAGLGGLALLAGLPTAAAQALVLAAALVLLAGSLVVLRRQTALFTVTLALGVASWVAGGLVWIATGNPGAALPWWLAFLVLTIAGERLELTRFLPARPGASRFFVAVVAVVLSGAGASVWHEEIGLAIFAAGLAALSGWLLRYDIARHNARQQGLVRFIAICLLSGYLWLALGGALGLAGALVAGHALRDAALHAVALGFVFSMVFGHAPIIFPAIVRAKLPYHLVFYLPLLLLHGSLAVRVAGGVWEDFPLRQQGAVFNAFALVLFILTMLTSVVRGRRAARAGAERRGGFGVDGERSTPASKPALGATAAAGAMRRPGADTGDIERKTRE